MQNFAHNLVRFCEFANMTAQLFIGQTVRDLRQAAGWRLAVCAQRLGVSASYLSQIESNQRPVTPRVLVALIDVFEAPASLFEIDSDHRLIADLKGALAESRVGGAQPPVSELKRVAASAPAFARRFIALHRAYARLTERLNLTDEAVGLDEAAAASSLLPYEEVRDFFQDKDNYLDRLDTAAEALADQIRIGSGKPSEVLLEGFLKRRLVVRIAYRSEPDLMRSFDAAKGVLTLNPSQPSATRAFQMAYQAAAMLLSPEIEEELARAGFRTRAAVDVCRVGLANYAAGAVLMPYRQFIAAAGETRHDLDRLALQFQVSLEQVCHRLSTLQRPSLRGVPFYFVRLDLAGNITKRHSATRFRFARFGGSCPLWNVHEAISSPDRYLVQTVEMPDGERYLSVARSIAKPSGAYLRTDRRFVLGLGCELRHADQLVYSQGVDLSAAPARIGVSCRICERDDCVQRAFPPIDRPLVALRDERRLIPYDLSTSPPSV